MGLLETMEVGTGNEWKHSMTKMGRPEPTFRCSSQRRASFKPGTKLEGQLSRGNGGEQRPAYRRNHLFGDALVLCFRLPV